MKTILKSNTFGLGLLLLLSFTLIYITDKYILSVGFYNNSGDIFSGIPGRDAEIYHSMQKWIYFSELIYLLLKLNLTALILYTALYLSDEPVAFSGVLNIVIYSEYVFLIPAAIKIPWFLYRFPGGTVLDWHKTYILSALSFFDDVPADWYYPLQVFNLFEVAYWFLLAYGLARYTGLKYDRCLQVILFSYVPALVVWVAAISFFTLMAFPNNS